MALMHNVSVRTHRGVGSRSPGFFVDAQPVLAKDLANVLRRPAPLDEPVTTLGRSATRSKLSFARTESALVGIGWPLDPRRSVARVAGSLRYQKSVGCITATIGEPRSGSASGKFPCRPSVQPAHTTSNRAPHQSRRRFSGDSHRNCLLTLPSMLICTVDGDAEIVTDG